MDSADRERLIAFFFKPDGRIGRTEYLLGVGFIWSAGFAVISLLVTESGPVPGLVLIAGAIALVLTIGQFVLVAKRSHDLGLPGIFVLLLFVPVIGIGWLLLLAAMPGNQRTNAYGPPPAFRPD